MKRPRVHLSGAKRRAAQTYRLHRWLTKSPLYYLRQRILYVEADIQNEMRRCGGRCCASSESTQNAGSVWGNASGSRR